MEIIEKKVEKIEKYYVSIDGKEFSTKWECKRHEARLEEEERYNKQQAFIDKYGIKEIEDRFPIGYEDLYSDSCCYTWLKIPNDDVLKELWELTDDKKEFKNISTPTIICFESDDDNNLLKGEYIHTLDHMVNTTKDFWKDLGYEIKVRKVG